MGRIILSRAWPFSGAPWGALLGASESSEWAAIVEVDVLEQLDFIAPPRAAGLVSSPTSR